MYFIASGILIFRIDAPSDPAQQFFLETLLFSQSKLLFFSHYRINADENDLPGEFYVSQYPSFILFPAQRYDFILLFKGTTMEALLRDTSIRGIQNWVPLICSQNLCLCYLYLGITSIQGSGSRHPCLISIWGNLRTEDTTLTASFRNLN